jgi:hypothetical protein
MSVNGISLCVVPEAVPCAGGYWGWANQARADVWIAEQGRGPP